ncbi:MAG TPA: hypothetical protein VG711_09190 [Phycisphaerales bacterium]|nr:hypothetical protein [Phycisphaerales bacterium]
MIQPSSSLVLPRNLIFAASVWLIISWGLALGFATPIQPSSATYTPGVRVMFLCVVTGCLIAWPLLRLSQSVSRFPIAQTILDLLVLLSLAQIVIWPLGLLTPWPTARTAAIDLTIISSTLLIGAFIAAAIASSHATTRILAMSAACALALLGPLCAVVTLAFASVPSQSTLELSPFILIYELAAADPSPPQSSQWHCAIFLSIAACLAWLMLPFALRSFRQAESNIAIHDSAPSA